MTRVLLTGMADGIGKALALRFADPAHDVLGVDRDIARGDAVVRTLRDAGATAALHACDLAQREEVDALATALAATAPFDLVVHCAGINCVGPFEHTDLEQQQAVLAVNLEAPLVLTAALLRAARVAAGGTIVFVSSLSHQVGYPGASVYAASKDGLASYARSLDVALHGEGIRTLRVFPGPVRTEHAARYSPPGSDPRKRMRPEDVAGAIVRAVRRRKRTLVPGAGPKVFAFLGRLAPRFTERALKRALYDPLTP